MKIGILTWFIGYNIGAVLQAKALQYKIQELFPEDTCETIYYQTREQENGYKMTLMLKNTVSRKIRSTLIGLLRLPILRRRKKIIDLFVCEYMNISSKYIGDNIVKSNREYDVFICGSDQIWNPEWLDSAYLLNFVQNGKKRIAYAASVGVGQIPVEQEQVYLNELRKFSAISTREETGKRAIEKIQEKNVEKFSISVVCDPTILLTKRQWNNLLGVNKKNSKPYIFCYFLSASDYGWHFAKKMGTKYGLELHAYDMQMRYMSNVKMISSLSPVKFVDEIANASLILTDSFHGTVFSIIEEIPFLVFERKLYSKNGNINMNSRIDELLENLGLMKHKMDLKKPLDEESIERIDWITVSEKIEKIYREPSIKWLATSLKDSI